MKIRFYQKEWFGLCLESISKSLGRPLNLLPDSDFYRRIYQDLIDGKGEISPAYIALKEDLARWIGDYLYKNNLSKEKILSLGCGLGFVEKKLIQSGFYVDLQECQDLSIQYLQKKDPSAFEKSTFICSEDLSNFQSTTYKTILALLIVPCLQDEILVHFFSDIARVLTPGGVFLCYDIPLTFFDLEIDCKRRLLRFPHVGKFWGWKRSSRTLISTAKRFGLSLCDQFYFDASFKSVKNPWVVGGIPLNRVVRSSMMIMKKNA